MNLKITIPDLHAGKLLEYADRQAERCLITAAFYQAIPKKAHLFQRWYDKAQAWVEIVVAIQTAALEAKREQAAET